VWAHGERAERRALLERLRRTDPAAGRELLASTFAEETWDDRESFLTTLAHGLSDADEPFLEAALDDARKPVRAAAATLLARLPRSRFAARMAERAAPLLRVENGSLIATLPGDPDAAAKRDGVPAGGRRSERLRALIAATPLVTWTGEAARENDPWPLPALAGTAPSDPSTLVSLGVADNLAPVVRSGWTQAAIAQRDPGWASALWGLRTEPALLAVLPRAAAEALAAAADDKLAAALALPGRWGEELSYWVLEDIRGRRSEGHRGVHVGEAGYRLHPAVEAQAETLRDLGGADLWELCDVLAIRAAMLRELG
jgi:hypothetical protein